jgi:hypothetical protein
MRASDSSVEILVDEAAQTDAYPAHYDPEEEMRPRANSYVRMRAETQTLTQVIDPYTEPPTTRIPAAGNIEISREVLANHLLNLTVNVLHLKRLLELEPGHPFARAATRLLGDRVGELEDVRDAVEAVLAVRGQRASSLFQPGSPMTAYLKGLFLFAEALSDAFEDVLGTAYQTTVDWMTLRMRVVEASHFYFDGLAQAVRNELEKTAPRGGTDLDECVEELFFFASYMQGNTANTLG